MLHRVTNRDTDEKVTRFAQWKRGLLIASHVLMKTKGNSITASWPVTNTGELTGSGGLDIEIFIPGGPSVGFIGPNMSVPAGATVTMNVTGVLASPLVAGQTYQGRLRLTPIAPATVGPGSTHDFSVTLAPPANAVLTAQGIPTIL